MVLGSVALRLVCYRCVWLSRLKCNGLMELNRDEVPVYGQVEVCAVLQDTQSIQEKAEYYVLLKGSHIHHVTKAQRKEKCHLLSFIIPGHNVAEKVSVWLYSWEDGSRCSQPTPMSEELSLEYKWDTVQEVADLLISDPDNLTSSMHVDIQRKFCLVESIQPGQNSLDVNEQHGTSRLDENLGLDQRLKLKTESGNHNPEENPECWEPDPGGCKLEPCSAIDVKITQAVSNMYSLLEWNNHKTQESQAPRQMETPLHIAVRLGLYHLTLFYLHQSGGQEMATLPNEEGHTPTELAQSRGHAATISALANLSACSEESPVWMSQIWADESHLLRLCPLTTSFILTVKNRINFDPQRSIQLYREKHRYLESHMQEVVLTEVEGKSRQNQTDDTSEGDLTSWTNVEDCVLLESVFEEQLVLSLDEDEENPTTYNSEKSCSPPGFSSPFQLQSTDITSARLTAMLNRTGKNDDHRKYNIATVPNNSSATDPQPAVKVEGTREQRPFSHPFSPSFTQFSTTSSAGLVLDRFLRGSSHSEHNNHSASSPPESYEISPNLVALEMDSEEEDDDLLMKKPLPQISSENKDNGDKQDRFNPSSGLSCTRCHSASSDCNHASQKDPADQGVRLRSYSYSSPKISLLSPRSSRDTPRPPADLSHEQRALSLTEQPQEKRELRFRRRTQSADDESSVELADSLQHLTLSEFLKEIEEEGWDKYIIPSKTEPEKYKVSRTFSFIKSRMYSTRSKKGKAKEKEVKEKQGNGHQFAAGPILGTSVCEVCDKPVSGKETLHCTNCAVCIHKGCKDSAAQCLKKVQDKYAVSRMKARAATLPQNFVLRESIPSSQISTSASLPVVTQRDRRDTTPLPCPISRSVPLVPEWFENILPFSLSVIKNAYIQAAFLIYLFYFYFLICVFCASRLAESPEGDTESSSWRSHGQSEELLQTMESSTSTDSSLVEETVDAPLQNSFGTDTLYLEAESWSLAVETQFCQKQEKRTIKRQDVIYELMQTELHHLQTLTIMAEVFRRGMREEVGLDAEAIGRIFPCLDELLVLHRDFLSAMTERRNNSTQPDNEKNYLIHHVGDILLQQFSQENAENMKRVYGEFCSRHIEAVSFFKELQQQNKRFQLFIKQQSSNLLVKRREIPECILLVTQRITKYPVLLERILQYTEEGTQEHSDISGALSLVRELISAVDLRVSEREQSQWLSDVLGRMESKSLARLKSGAAFRKHDMTNGRTLLHHGPLLWKTATGRLKDVLALLLTDLLIFLQEKDQKYIFATVDQKCPVISLQKLIVREVANEERGMFLISASSSGPEMYEVHAATKDERKAWMRLIREAVEICHEKEEVTASESEEERSAAEAKNQRIQKLQESLCSHDQLICSSLEEKLHIYAELAAMVGHRDISPEPKLLVCPNTEELPNAAVLLNAALKEAENLKEALSFHCNSTSRPGPLPVSEEQNTSDTTTQLEATPPAPSPPPLPAEEEPQAVDAVRSEEEELREDSLELQLRNQSSTTDNHNMYLKVCQSIQSLTQLLYSLQAVVTIQDSRYEVRRLLLLLLSSSAHQRISQGSLQEQERQREAERRRQDLARAARERQRWARECQAQHLRYEERESELAQREQRCHEEVQRLQRQREELEEQQQEYQQSLERLREGQRSVERERERLEMQQRMMGKWRHERQHNLPVTSIKLEGHQGSGDETKNFHHGHHSGLDEDGSIFVNEAAFLAPSMNNRHLHHYQHQYQHNTHLHPGYVNSPSAQNSLNSLLALSNHTHPTISTQDELWTEDVGPAIHTTRTAGAVGPGIYQGDALLVPQAFISMETENQDPDGEEKIVYL
ncbi:rho guanine nucleotide exchange factor 28 isoform X3 [Ictalurus furcatus]|uniref:rho guanine nucleotide exchange factor 28 isoform X3 n=1 Tax=Ictalurus furcatus TaxID=66913 RepID=UPI00235008DC|nr:rho guanine nucleotide exchange factor 28 isoform X3 [Ictalurus furcatus]